MQLRDQKLSELRQELEPALHELDNNQGVSLDIDVIKEEVRRRLAGQGSQN